MAVAGKFRCLALYRYRSRSVCRYRPLSMQSRRFRADIEHAGGGRRIAILSTTWQTVSLMAPQDHDYRAFHHATASRGWQQAGSKAALLGGLGPVLRRRARGVERWWRSRWPGFWCARSPPANSPARCFWSDFAALFGWQIGGFCQAQPAARPYDVSIICRKRPCCRSILLRNQAQ